jgi:general stress protein 26
MTRDEEITKIGDLIRGIRAAMLTTHDGENLRSRPMAMLSQPFDGTLWFFTKRSAAKSDEILADQRVNVSFADPSDERYVSLSGRAAIVRDVAKNRAMWNIALQGWFPDGPDDPDVALVQINVDAAEYWEATQSKMVRLFEYAKASITGKPLDHDDLGENKKIKLT